MKGLFTRAAVMAGMGSFALTASADAPTAAVDAYLAGARAVVAELNDGAPNGALIASRVTAMLESAKPVVAAYGQAHRQCAEQLERLIELYPEINRWSAVEIRRDVEAGAALPAAEGCYAARDIVAHPAIVRAIVRAGIGSQAARLVREMNEAVEHMEEISAELSE